MRKRPPHNNELERGQTSANIFDALVKRDVVMFRPGIDRYPN
jgi:hypothetical protein